jgi:hypothetical protein
VKRRVSRFGILRSLAALGAGVALVCAPSGAGAADSLEVAVKATYLYKLAPFVDWPAQAFAAPDSPLVLCVQGADPFGAVLDRAVGGQRIAAHPLQVRRMEVIDATSGCHIAYVGGSKRQPAIEALRALRGAGVLTVTDGDASLGVVRFVMQDNRVRFEIDTTGAAEDRLTLSSKLLSLALAVRGRP